MIRSIVLQLAFFSFVLPQVIFAALNQELQVLPSTPMALQKLFILAERGDVNIQLALAAAYLKGDLVPKDLSVAAY